MKVEQARKLAKKLENAEGVPDDVVAFVDDDEEFIIFASDATGDHWLSIANSDRARVLAHWKGFLANQPKTTKARRSKIRRWSTRTRRR